LGIFSLIERDVKRLNVKEPICETKKTLVANETLSRFRTGEQSEFFMGSLH